MLFIKVGLVPELASTHFLVQRVGFGRASEMCLSGRLYAGARRTRWGSPTASRRPTTCCRRRSRSARDDRRQSRSAAADDQGAAVARTAARPISARCSGARPRCCASAGSRPSTAKPSRRSSRSGRRGSGRRIAPERYQRGARRFRPRRDEATHRQRITPLTFGAEQLGDGAPGGPNTSRPQSSLGNPVR